MSHTSGVLPSDRVGETKQSGLLIAALLGLSLCLAFLLSACSPAASADEEARELLANGDLAAAAQKALEIEDADTKEIVLQEIMLEAMDAQNVYDYGELGISDISSYMPTYVNAIKDQLLSLAASGGGTIDSVIPDFSNPDCAAAIESGNKVKKIYNNYKSIITPEVQSQLSPAAQDLDERYREVCEDTSTLLSQSGIQSFLMSPQVLGTKLGTGTPSVDIQTLANNVERFTLDYNNMAGDLALKTN